MPAVPPEAGAIPRSIRVGGNVQQAQLIRQIPPVYPSLAKNARISGPVRLKVVVAGDGTVKEVTYISGHALLANAAMDAVRQWIYKPTLLRGQPVEVVTEVEVNFTLSAQ